MIGLMRLRWRKADISIIATAEKYMDGYCTHCHQAVKVHKVRHRAEGRCPKCGVKVVFLAEGKAKHILTMGRLLISRNTERVSGSIFRCFQIVLWRLPQPSNQYEGADAGVL